MCSKRAGLHGHHVFLFNGAKIPQEWLEMDGCQHVAVKKASDYFWQDKVNKEWN